MFETADCAAIVQMCNTARNKRFMLGLLADTGMGKTTALTAFAACKNTYYISYDKSMNPKQFFAALLKEMGISFDGSTHAILNRVCTELNELETPLLLIDEASKLNHKMILYLHELRDKTIKNCGIVLAGMPYFKENLIKHSERQREGYAEFYRRVNMWHELEGLTRKEVEAVCGLHNITDENFIRELRNKKRFGDLMNEILLHQIINE